MPDRPLHRQIALGHLTLDLDRGTLSRDGEMVGLRAKSFALLGHLASHAGQVVSKAELLDAVWPAVTVTEDSLTQAIRDIRRALGPDAARHLRTVARRGYVLDIAPVGAAALPGPGLPRIAFLPFSDPSGPAERRPLLEALAETVAQGLARFRHFTVLAQQSSLAAASAAPGAPMQAARRLRADYIVTGTAWPSVEGLAITLSLSGVADERLIWSERYDLGAAEILTLSDIVPRQIVQRLATSVDTDGQLRAAAMPPERLTAFDHLARGRFHLRSGAPGAAEAARDHFARAIASDPGFGAAHSYHALADVAVAGFGLAAPEIIAHCREGAERGLALAPDEAAVWRIAGYFRAMTLDFAAAEETVARAIALNPCSASALYEMSFVLMLRGRHTESLDWLARAEEVDPLFPVYYEFTRSEALYLIGRYAEAVASLLKVPRLSVRQYVRLAAAYAQLGESGKALAALERVEALEPGWDYEGTLRRSYICENPADLDHMLDGVRKALAFRDRSPAS